MGRQRTLEAISKSEYVTIGELVRLTKVRYSTLKFYTEEGLIPFEQAEEKLTRRYPRLQTIQKINEIIQLRQQGLSMDEVKSKLLG